MNGRIGGSTGRGRARAWGTALWLGTTAMGGIVWSSPAMAQQAATRDYAIVAASLGDALIAFGRQSGLQVSVTADDVRGISSPGVSGPMTTDMALTRLLAGTGFTWRLRDGVVAIERLPTPAAPAGTITTDALKVEGQVAEDTGAARDARGHDDVFDRDASSSYAGKAEVERYRGASVADVLRGMVNVYSGDARNSGALDPSIRGIQGPGRVPVIVDGTEQALTVWRGYNGASNRNYVDPSLIADVQVLKGPVSDRDVHGSTGGAVVINTLNVIDVLRPGQRFGIDVHLEGGNNSTGPRLPTLRTGQDFNTIPGFPGAAGSPPYSNPSYPYLDPTLRIQPRTSDDNHLFSMGDRAVRIAAAGRIGDIDLIGAYAWRERGNYFAGTTGAGYYRQAALADTSDFFVRRLALDYLPGEEVTNTSSRLASWLAKATWHIADDQYLQFGFRDSSTRYGEIMPSRIIFDPDLGLPQWPLSRVHLQSYNAEYKWQPRSRWIDLKANLWATRTGSHTYTRGGFPNAASFDDPILSNTAVSNSQDNRIGFTASNKVRLGSRFDLTLAGNWQHEKLTSPDGIIDTANCNFCQFPRAGRRDEYNVRLDGEWRPAPFLKLNAGITRSGYTTRDDFLRRQLQAGNGDRFAAYIIQQYDVTYSGTGQRFYEDWVRQQYAGYGTEADIRQAIADGLPGYLAAPYDLTGVLSPSPWLPRADGRFYRADDPCRNGAVAALAGYDPGSCFVSGNNNDPIAPTLADTRRHHSGWTPSASATVYFSQSSCAYLRYAQVLRFPSIFESTLGFSASYNPLRPLKPEHGYFWEAGYIQDLRGLFGLAAKDQRADLKLTWYRNAIHDVIDRDVNLRFGNLDRQVIEGLELQARYDSGTVFTDLSAAHMLANTVCDQNFAVQGDPNQWRIPDCVKYGFPTTFLLTQATPENSVNWTAGGRLLDRRLELGGRLIWYGRYRNPQLDRFIGGSEADRIGGSGLNVPFTWGNTITLDAYASFRLNDRFSAEIVGTNLNDRYFADPLTRSLMPAPGRTVRISLTGRI